MHISKYFSDIRNHILQFPFIVSSEIKEDIRTPNEGFIKAKIFFIDSSELSYREYVSTESEPPVRYSYSFHFFKNNTLVFRYDNAPHHKVSSFPHHKHFADGRVISCSPPTIESVLGEIKNFIS